MIGKDLLDLLVCPVTGSSVVFNSNEGLIVNQSGSLGYPVRHGIPIMVAAEAVELASEHEKRV